MSLTSIQLNLEGNEGQDSDAFYLEHIEHIFMANLPKDIELDGHEKLVINCFQKPISNLDRFASFKSTLGGLASFQMTGFDPITFQNANTNEKQRVAALWIRNALIELSERFKITKEAIEATYSRTIESGFKLEWIHKKSSKSRGDRKLKLETKCTHDRKGVSVTLHFKSKQKTFATATTDTGRRLRGLDFDYNSITWDSDTVTIYNTLGDPYLRFRISEDNTVELLGSTKAVRLMRREQTLDIESTSR